MYQELGKQWTADTRQHATNSEDWNGAAAHWEAGHHEDSKMLVDEGGGGRVRAFEDRRSFAESAARDSNDSDLRPVAQERSLDISRRTGKKNIMVTGCIPCLIRGIPCDPGNPACNTAMSSDWSTNEGAKSEYDSSDDSSSLSTIRLDTKWRRNWRERHSLNFFVTFSAPQMAGFFETAFWGRCIQHSYSEPVILHAISAIGSLHEAILQGAFQDEKRRVQAVEFALTQCNRSIGYLTGIGKAASGTNGSRSPRTLPVSKLALIACVLFTCFESMQGHCDSAVRHALQGKALMEAHHSPGPDFTSKAEDDIELMRPLVERLEVQATALVGKGDRPVGDETSSVPPLPAIDRIFNLDHAHLTLHTAMNSNMRYSQRFHPDAPADHHAVTHAQKVMRYGPWYANWETAFSAWLLEHNDTMSNMDRKRAMVLKANQIVGTMLAAADQRAGPAAYDRFDDEFRAIVDLAREVLADFSCPPLPSLTAGTAGTPYFSCSLWVTDPLWMAISRCRDPTTRQAAFDLLRQNPRQEGIWHAGPQALSQLMRKIEVGHTSLALRGPKSASPASSGSSPDSGSAEIPLGEVPKNVSHAQEAGNMRARAEWVDLMASSQTPESSSDDAGG